MSQSWILCHFISQPVNWETTKKKLRLTRCIPITTKTIYQKLLKINNFLQISVLTYVGLGIMHFVLINQET